MSQFFVEPFPREMQKLNFVPSGIVVIYADTFTRQIYALQNCIAVRFQDIY